MEEEILKEIKEIKRTLLIYTKEALNTEEAALFIGCTKERIRSLVSEGKIPYYKPKGRLFFKKSEIENWMLSNRRASDNEIEEQAVGYILNHKAQ